MLLIHFSSALSVIYKEIILMSKIKLIRENTSMLINKQEKLKTELWIYLITFVRLSLSTPQVLVVEKLSLVQKCKNYIAMFQIGINQGEYVLKHKRS